MVSCKICTQCWLSILLNSPCTQVSNSWIFHQVLPFSKRNHFLAKLQFQKIFCLPEHMFDYVVWVKGKMFRLWEDIDQKRWECRCTKHMELCSICCWPNWTRWKFEFRRCQCCIHPPFWCDTSWFFAWAKRWRSCNPSDGWKYFLLSRVCKKLVHFKTCSWKLKKLGPKDLSQKKKLSQIKLQDFCRL